MSYAIQCVGRMALSNYLLQSLIGTTLFYRFGLFMHFMRGQLVMMVPGIWCINLLFSVLWLRLFPAGAGGMDLASSDTLSCHAAPHVILRKIMTVITKVAELYVTVFIDVTQFTLSRALP